MYGDLITRIREIQKFTDAAVPLHAPVFKGNEKKYVLDAIDSTYVSSVGEYVNRFERMLEGITGATRAVACCNGTAALEMALRLAEVKPGDAVITQAISFVATANAIAHLGASPIFVDIERKTLGLSPEALLKFLEDNCVIKSGECILKNTGRRVAACVPMHTFGLPVQLDKLIAICEEWKIVLVEDAAEAMGSRYDGRHCGTYGLLGILSFNGNKIVTTGGGGAILSNDPELGKKAKHLTTTAKIPHAWEFKHDSIGWNYRLPNLNAAIGCAQLERLNEFLAIKRARANEYAKMFADLDWEFVLEPDNCRSNYWLCAVLTNSETEKQIFLKEANEAGIGCRPMWEPLHTLPMYKDCERGELSVSIDMASRLINLPSGVGEGLPH